MMATVPAQLKPSLQSWDGGGLRDLYREHRWSLVRLAALLLHDPVDAEEIVQDAFVQAHLAWGRLRDPDKALSYLRSAVLNRCRSRLRHLKVVDRLEPPAPTPSPSPEAETEAGDDRRRLVAALRSLPDRPRQPTFSAPSATPMLGYQPLWPFRDQAEADNRRARHQAGGAQPWHLDAAETAISFSRGYLGYADITTAFGTRSDALGAHVTVGFANPAGQPVNAAVVHLVRFGPAADAPWEVVGTDDTDFTLTTPSYGATVISPVTVGGRITGVDENIKVQVLQPSSTTPLRVSSGTPAGGTNSPWHTTVAFPGPTDPVLTIAASTGGHLAGVERFTVTGLRRATS